MPPVGKLSTILGKLHPNPDSVEGIQQVEAVFYEHYDGITLDRTAHKTVCPEADAEYVDKGPDIPLLRKGEGKHNLAYDIKRDDGRVEEYLRGVHLGNFPGGKPLAVYPVKEAEDGGRPENYSEPDKKPAARCQAARLHLLL